MCFISGERLPKVGETCIMSGSFGVDYAVTIHKIKARTERDEYIYLDVIATRRAIASKAGAEHDD